MTELSPITIDPDTFLHKHCAMPALPEVSAKIQKIILSKNVSIAKVAELISLDPALVAQTLKIVNSAYYSLPLEISEVKLAVAYLGLSEVHRIVLSISVINTLTIKDKKSFNEIWFHSILTALCANYLAKKFDPLLDTNELWPAALLHDVGKFLYLKFFPDHYKELKRFSKKKNCLFSEAEAHYSLPASAYLGTLLCDRWKLPLQIKSACSLHGIEELKGAKNVFSKKPFINCIRLANLTAILSTDDIKNEKKEEIMKIIMNTLNISESNLVILLSDVLELKETARNLV